MRILVLVVKDLSLLFDPQSTVIRLASMHVPLHDILIYSEIPLSFLLLFLPSPRSWSNSKFIKDRQAHLTWYDGS